MQPSVLSETHAACLGEECYKPADYGGSGNGSGDPIVLIDDIFPSKFRDSVYV